MVYELLLIEAGRRDPDEFTVDGIANFDRSKFDLRGRAERWLVIEGWGDVVVDVDVAAVLGRTSGAVADAHADRDTLIAAESTPIISAANATRTLGRDCAKST